MNAMVAQAFSLAGGRTIHDTTNRPGLNLAAIHSVPFSTVTIEVIEGDLADIDQWQGTALTHPWALTGRITRLKLSAGKLQAVNAIDATDAQKAALAI